MNVDKLIKLSLKRKLLTCVFFFLMFYVLKDFILLESLMKVREAAGSVLMVITGAGEKLSQNPFTGISRISCLATKVWKNFT